MAQAIICQYLKAETRVQARVSLRGIYGGQNGSRTQVFPSSSVYPCQCHSAVALHTHMSPG
jgi:hypothetical protein